MKRREQQTDSFKVKTESGTIYSIIEITHQTYDEYIDPSRSKWMDGIKELKVVGGGHANRISNTEFEIVATGDTAVRC